MAEVWVAYDHVVHYKVDIDNEEILEVEIPGWMNTFGEPGSIWTEDGTNLPLTDEQEDAMIEVLENQSMPTPYWG
jgi:hypothetical protein